MGTTSEELQYSEPPTRICGQDEAYAVDVVPGADGRKRLSIDDQPLTYGTPPAEIIVSTSAVEAKAGVSRLAGRRVLSLMPLNGILYYGFSDSVTTSNGMKVFTNQQISMDVGDVAVWLIAAGPVSVRIVEAK